MTYKFNSNQKMYDTLVPCIILVDSSSHMEGLPITNANCALAEFQKVLDSEPYLGKKIDVCVMSYGDTIKTVLDFLPGKDFCAPILSAAGSPILDEGINAALDKLDQRRALYRELGVNYSSPFLFVITDGIARVTHAYSVTTAAEERLSRYIQQKKIHYFPVVVNDCSGNYSTELLQKYYPLTAVAKPVYQPSFESFREILEKLFDDDYFLYQEAECEPFESKHPATDPPPLPTWLNCADPFQAMNDDSISTFERTESAHPPMAITLSLREDKVDYPPVLSTVTIPLDDPDRVSPCVFLIDRSSNISSKALTRGEQMIQDFCNDLESTDHIKDAEICVISYADDVTVDVDFCKSSSVKIPSHIPSGGAAFNEALLLALDKLEQKQTEYSSCGKHCRTPYIFAVGTGTSTDPELKTAVIERMQQLVAQRSLYFYAVGCGMVDVAQFCSYYGASFIGVKAVYPSITAALSSSPIVSRSVLEPITISLSI